MGDAERREERLSCVQIDREMDLIQHGFAPVLRHSDGICDRETVPYGVGR